MSKSFRVVVSLLCALLTYLVVAIFGFGFANGSIVGWELAASAALLAYAPVPTLVLWFFYAWLLKRWAKVAVR